MISPRQAAPRALRGVARACLHPRTNGGAAEAEARKRCRFPDCNQEITARWRHLVQVAWCQFGAVPGLQNSMCRQTLAEPWRRGQTANVSSLYLALLIGLRRLQRYCGLLGEVQLTE